MFFFFRGVPLISGIAQYEVDVTANFKSYTLYTQKYS